MEHPTRAALRTPSSSTQLGAFKSPDLTQATPTPAHTLGPPPASPCSAPSAASGWACPSPVAPPLSRVHHSRLPPLPWRGSPPPRPAPPIQARGPTPSRLAPPTFPPVNCSGFRLSSGLRDNAAFAARDWKPRASPEPAAAALKSALRIVGVSRPPVGKRRRGSALCLHPLSPAQAHPSLLGLRETLEVAPEPPHIFSAPL